MCCHWVTITLEPQVLVYVTLNITTAGPVETQFVTIYRTRQGDARVGRAEHESAHSQGHSTEKQHETGTWISLLFINTTYGRPRLCLKG